MIRLISSTALTLSILLSLTLPNKTAAWGALGHETIAYLAQSYVRNSTASYIQSILSSTDQTSYMASVATWADSYRYTSAGAFSAPYHYIDARDSPPQSCSVDFTRDCGSKGCSVAAIANYTSILLAGTAGASEQADAMKFLIHFVGDLHQPLHDEAVSTGGNGISVTYDGRTTNLHHIWDTQIPEELATGSSAGSDTLSAAAGFAASLANSIATGEFGWDASAWVAGLDVMDAQGTAMGWASEANAYVCSDVLTGGVDAVQNGGDLDGEYYQAHVAVARIQIARAGYRLGAYLDALAAAIGGSQKRWVMEEREGEEEEMGEAYDAELVLMPRNCAREWEGADRL